MCHWKCIINIFLPKNFGASKIIRLVYFYLTGVPCWNNFTTWKYNITINLRSVISVVLPPQEIEEIVKIYCRRDVTVFPDCYQMIKLSFPDWLIIRFNFNIIYSGDILCAYNIVLHLKLVSIAKFCRLFVPKMFYNFIKVL